MKGRIEATVVTPVRVVAIKRRKMGRDTVVLDLGGKSRELCPGDILEVEGRMKYESK